MEILISFGTNKLNLTNTNLFKYPFAQVKKPLKTGVSTSLANCWQILKIKKAATSATFITD
jgi:hypothetical protein